LPCKNRAAPRPPLGRPRPAQPRPRPPPPGQSQTGPDGLYIGAPARSFGEAVSTCFTKYFTFSGRASRSEYWFFALLGFIIGLIPGLNLLGLVLFIPSLAVTVRRLHDTDRSGWWLVGPLLVLLPLLFFLGLGAARNPTESLAPLGALVLFIWGAVMLVFMCLRGTPGPNRFG
jgi:uncharacterized membrane protein YhaH (DUF805 family)